MKFPHFGKSSGTDGKFFAGFDTLKINDMPLDHSEVFSLLNSQYPETQSARMNLYITKLKNMLLNFNSAFQRLTGRQTIINSKINHFKSKIVENRSK